MATTGIWGPYIRNNIDLDPHGGIHYFGVGPFDFGNATFTVSAHGLTGLVSGPQYLEVVQNATRAAAPGQHFLDIVVRNNSPTRCRYFEAWISFVRQ
jgi:hypothetical protein